MKLMSEKEIVQVMERFKKQMPDPQPELYAPNPYCFLVSVVLSAQATDKSVNLATEDLYKIADSPEKMLALGEEKLISYIRPIGLYKNKAKNVIKLSQTLVEKFDSKIPRTREELESLSGVGRKTANVVLNVIYGQNTMPVDTHLMRVGPKTGLAEGKNPLQVEESLLKRIPEEYLKDAHHWLLLHGRYVCTARNPKCDQCLIADLCCHNE
jgi:endonuclease-3